jgi:hypothetical protein
MADNQTQKCAHPACACPAAKDSKYCSTFCAGKADKPDITCNCGHAACAVEAVASVA